MENLCSLFVELSNEDRLRILRHLSKEGKKVSHLSRELGLAIQESSRHLSRLSEAGFTRKAPDGLYHITALGELILRELSAVRFTMEHKEYFATHSLAHIPLEFVCRIGELAESKFVNQITVVSYTIEKIMQEAEKYALVIADQYFFEERPMTVESFKIGVKTLNIEAKDRVISTTDRSLVWYPKLGEGVREEDRQALFEARTTGFLEERVLDRLDVYMQMSEKEAVIAFPLMDGSFDHLGFVATDRRSRKWCKDLFHYYWERARPRASIAQELYEWLRKRPGVVRAFKRIVAEEETVEEEELILELESMSLIKQGKLTLLGELVAGKYCIYCGTPNPHGDAFCQTCKRKMPEI